MDLTSHQELCARMMMPDSERLARIWSMIVDQDEAKMILALPGTAGDLAAKIGLASEEVADRLRQLFHKGVVFYSAKPQGKVYRGPKHLIQFHDASVQWPEAPVEFYDLWKEFMHEEFPQYCLLAVNAGFPSFMRAIPTLQAVKSMTNVEDFQNVASIVEKAEKIAICKCPCRLVERNCDSPMETCIQFGKGAEYVLERGTGRALTKEEALKLVAEFEEQGLVHFVNNNQGLGTFMCNCCDCCCSIIKPTKQEPATRPIMAPSLYLAEVYADQCIADGLCEDVCPVDAIKVDDSQEQAVVSAELCIGCGLCLAACNFDALALKQVRQPEFVPD